MSVELEIEEGRIDYDDRSALLACVARNGKRVFSKLRPLFCSACRELDLYEAN